MNVFEDLISKSEVLKVLTDAVKNVESLPPASSQFEGRTHACNDLRENTLDLSLCNDKLQEWFEDVTYEHELIHVNKESCIYVVISDEIIDNKSHKILHIVKVLCNEDKDCVSETAQWDVSDIFNFSAFPISCKFLNDLVERCIECIDL